MNIQYMMAFIAFIGLVMYIYSSYSKNVPDFINEISKEAVRSEAFQLSELLINDAGEPSNWETAGSPRRLGFSDELMNKSNLISKSKIDNFNGNYDCMIQGDYDQVKSLLGLKTDQNPTIIISKIEDSAIRTPLLECYPPSASTGTLSSRVTRVVAYTEGAQEKLGEVVVLV